MACFKVFVFLMWMMFFLTIFAELVTILFLFYELWAFWFIFSGLETSEIVAP